MPIISTAVVYLIKSECACVIITSWGCTGGVGDFVKRNGGLKSGKGRFVKPSNKENRDMKGRE